MIIKIVWDKEIWGKEEEMGEIKSGDGDEGIRPGQESAAALTPDLEQEKREIEARIEQHRTKIEEVAMAFGIDTASFSPDEDRKLASQIDELRDYIGQNESQVEDKAVYIDGFKSEGNPRYLRETSGKNIFDDHGAAHLVTEVTGEGGRPLFGEFVSEFHHPLKLIPDMDEAGKKFLTRDEDQAFIYFGRKYAKLSLFGGRSDRQPYFDQPGLSIVDLWESIRSQLALVRLRSTDKEDKDVAGMLENLPPNYKPAHIPELQLVSKLMDLPLEPRMRIGEMMSDCQDFPESFYEVSLLAARVYTRIVFTYNERYHYLVELAKSGDHRFMKKGSGTMETYSVSEDFQFTEEDARKAREMNLPWSRIEKETKE